MFDGKHVDGPFLKPVYAPTRTQTRTRIIWGRFVPHLKEGFSSLEEAEKDHFKKLQSI